MAIDELFTLPKPKVITSYTSDVDCADMDPEYGERTRAWLDADKKMLRYDIFDGKLPIILFTDDKNNPLPIPEFLGVILDETGNQITTLNKLYSEEKEHRRIEITYSNHPKSVFGDYGSRYSYTIGFGDANAICSINVSVKNRAVFGNPTIKNPDMSRIETDLAFYKWDDNTIHKTLMLFLPADRSGHVLNFGPTGEPKEMMVANVYRDIDELDEIVSVLGDKTLKTDLLKNIQAEGAAYLRDMEKFKQIFGDMKPLDYEAILNGCVEYPTG